MKKRVCVRFVHLMCKNTSIEVLHPLNDFSHLFESCFAIVYVFFRNLEGRGILLSRIHEFFHLGILELVQLIPKDLVCRYVHSSNKGYKYMKEPHLKLTKKGKTTNRLKATSRKKQA